MGHEEFVDSEPDGEPPFRMVGAVAARAAFRSIQSVNLVEALQDRPSVMKSVPRFLQGPYRIVMRCALEEMLAGARGHNVEREENGWRLLMLLPRMLLHRPPRGGGIPKHKLLERSDMFNRGQWEALLAAGGVCCTQAAVRRRRPRLQGDNIPGRV